MTDFGKVYVAGHSGMVGSAVSRKLQGCGVARIVGKPSVELDLTRQADVDAYFDAERPDCVVLAAASVGGLFANEGRHSTYLSRNAQMELNVIEAAARHGVQKLVFIASACIYPTGLGRPARESDFLSGPPDPTHAGYGMAKTLGVEYCRLLREERGLEYTSVVPCNLYGPGDNFNLSTCHVAPGLIRRFHEAKERGDTELVVRGSGGDVREFLYVDDLASAIVFTLKHEMPDAMYNIGIGRGTTIAELADCIRDVVEYHGSVRFELPFDQAGNGRILDVSRLSDLGWSYSTSLAEGISATYRFFCDALSRKTLRC